MENRADTGRVLEWVLRTGAGGTFIGHGLVALIGNPRWIVYLNTVGFPDELAAKVMPLIGVTDVLVGLIILIRPWKPVVVYALIWAFLTALIRPLSGESVLAFIERSSNWAVPLALFVLLSRKADHGQTGRGHAAGSSN